MSEIAGEVILIVFFYWMLMMIALRHLNKKLNKILKHLNIYDPDEE